MSFNKTKDNESINLVDFFRVFKKNLKIFYFLMALSAITSIVAVSVKALLQIELMWIVQFQ